MVSIISKRKFLPLFALICAFLWGCGFSVVKSGYEMFGIDSGDVQSKILFAGLRFILAGLMTLSVFACYTACITQNPGEIRKLTLVNCAWTLQNPSVLSAESYIRYIAEERIERMEFDKFKRTMEAIKNAFLKLVLTLIFASIRSMIFYQCSIKLPRNWNIFADI